MAKHGKKFTAAAAQVPDRLLYARGGDPPRPAGEVREVRRDGGAVAAAGRRSEARRSDGARHRRAPARTRQEQAGARHCRGRQAEGRGGSRRRRRRRRRHRGENPRRLARLRRRGRHARHDARRGPPRQGARAAGPDAEPEDRDRHAQRGAGDREIKAGKVEFRVDKTGIVHAPLGKTSFPAQSLIDNAHALVESVVKAKPAAAKGKYLKSATVSSTMGPGFAIDTAHIDERVKA
jgi:hypothetical protein